MLFTVLTSAALLAGPVQQTDTVFPVRPTARLDLHTFGGEVVIRTWKRNEMRVVAEHGVRERIEISASDAGVTVRVRSRRGLPRSVSYRITLPATMDIDIGGTHLDVDIGGVRGAVRVETVQGDIVLRGGSRFVTLHTVSGDVICEGAEGRLDVGSVNGAVTVRESRGEVIVETVNGDIVLERIRSELVEGSTVNGDIAYDGVIGDNGRYRFTTHNGAITVGIPERTNATVSVSTFNGEFESDFPVTLTETRRGGKRLTFTLGAGRARIELDSFSGTIRLVRPRSRGP